MFRVTRYLMISKTESGRVSKEIPGSGWGSGTRWALFLVCNIFLHTTPQARGADPKQRCLDLKTELEQNYKVYALFQENFFYYMDCSFRLGKNTFETVYL